MAPEQATGEPLDGAQRPVRGRGDPLRDAGRPAGVRRAHRRARSSTRRVYEQPPALTGSPAVAAIDRVLRRALAKRPADRPASAEAMADDLRAVPLGDAGHAPLAGRAGADARGGPAVPRAASRPRDRLPRLQPARRDRDVAVAPSRRSWCAPTPWPPGSPRDAGPEGHRRRGGRRSRGDGHARCAPATGCASSAQLVEAPGGRAADVAHRRVVRWATSSGCRTTSPRASSTRCRCRSARDDAADAGRARATPRAYELYLRANELARTLRRPPRRPRPLRAVPGARLRASPRRGRSWAAATGSSASTSRPRTTARRAPNRRSAARWRSTRA